MEIKIVDEAGQEIKVGSTVAYGAESDPAEVIEITDPDCDYDDGLGRAREIPPRVTVRFPEGDEDVCSSHNVTPLTWADYPDGPDVWVYEVSDIVLRTES